MRLDVKVAFAIILAWYAQAHSLHAATMYSYDSLNRLTNVDYGNGSAIRYTYDAAGNRLTYSGVVANDTTPPSVAVTNPTSGSTFATTNTTINLSGTASDNDAVSLVTWANDRGGIGTATGTTNWNITGVHLQPGANVISVTAYDAAGNKTPAALTVTLSSGGPSCTNQLTGCCISNGVFGFMLNGAAGSNYVIQVSSNLVNWVNQATNGIPAGGVSVLDFPIQTNQPQMFYRALPLSQGP